MSVSVSPLVLYVLCSIALVALAARVTKRWYAPRKDVTTPADAAESRTDESHTQEPIIHAPTVHVLPVELLGPDDDVEPFELCMEDCDMGNVLDALGERLYLRRPSPPRTHVNDTPRAGVSESA